MIKQRKWLNLLLSKHENNREKRTEKIKRYTMKGMDDETTY